MALVVACSCSVCVGVLLRGGGQEAAELGEDGSREVTSDIRREGEREREGGRARDTWHVTPPQLNPSTHGFTTPLGGA